MPRVKIVVLPEKNERMYRAAQLGKSVFCRSWMRRSCKTLSNDPENVEAEKRGHELVVHRPDVVCSSEGSKSLGRDFVSGDLVITAYSIAAAKWKRMST